MYTEKHVIPLFLKACSEWKKNLEEERMDWNAEKPGLYNEIAVLARYIVNAYKNQLTKDFPKIFNTLELIIQEGNEKAKELVVVGLIEDIQNISSWESFSPDVFKQWLKEESLQAWNDIEKLWHGNSSLERSNK